MFKGFKTFLWVFFFVLSACNNGINGQISNNQTNKAFKSAQVTNSLGETYTWQNVKMGGGGYITSIIAHPMEEGLVYARTDNGGAYRRDAQSNQWVPITDQFGLDLENFYGIDGLAIDPKDPDIVYICAGKGGSPSAILKSTDRGKTWTQLKSLYFRGNGDRRWLGETILVDPNNSDVIFSGSRNEGLFRSLDAGQTWTLVSGVPNGANDIGIRSVMINPNSTVNGRSRQIFAAPFDSGIYMSNDGGESFSSLAGAPSKVHRMAVDRNGSLLVTSADGVHRYDGTWKNISPNNSAFNALSVDSQNPNRIVVVREYRDNGESAFRNPIYYTEDGGQSWTDVENRSSLQFVADWFPSRSFSAATASAAFDPFNSKSVLISDWYGTWKTQDITASNVLWQQLLEGHEQMSVLAVLSLPQTDENSNPVVLSGVADNKGFRHQDLQSYPSSFFDSRLDTSSFDFTESEPDKIFKLGQDGEAAYSDDQGQTWILTQSWPYGENGKVAVSATDPNLVVIVPVGESVKRSTNRGNSWQSTSGTSSGTISSKWDKDHPIASDRVNGNTFYFMDESGDFFRSIDGGATFAKRSSLPTGGMYMVKAAPALAQVVFVSVEDEGLFASNDGGQSFAKLPDVSRARLFAFGKNAPGTEVPTLFLYGTVSGETGVFRSTDLGNNFVRLNDDDMQFAAHIKSMDGDRNIYGRVFIGTGGRGLIYGDLVTIQTQGEDPSDNGGSTMNPTPSPDGPTPSETASYQITSQIADDMDDVEENVPSGKMYTNSTDIELTHDGSRQQIVGLRFTNVAIPRGAKIIDARIQFTVDESDSDTTNLVIYGEAQDDASNFSSSYFNVSQRQKTQAFVPWMPAPWISSGDAGVDQRTPNLNKILQEIVNRQGWSAGNAMAFVIEGTGCRTAESYKGSQSDAAQLIVNFEMGASDDLPTNPSVDTSPPEVTLMGVESGATVSGLVNLMANAIDNVGVASVTFRWDSENFTGPDTMAPYTYSWDTTKFPDDLYTLTAVAVDTAGNSTISPIVTVRVKNQVTSPDLTLQSLEIPINSDADDVEERVPSGSMYTDSTDIELTHDASRPQVIGLLFRDIRIPKGAVIQRAHIQFTVDETSSGDAQLILRGQSSDNAESFTSSDFNVSSRSKTQASVLWQPPAWTSVGDAGSAQKTPDLTSIAQEIVNRAGWNSGHSMAFIIEGTGSRTADSYKGSASNAARLVIEFLGATSGDSTGGDSNDGDMNPPDDNTPSGDPTPNPDGNILKVPGNYSSVQSAINAARSGDTIVLARGSYSGGITISGKAITLTSEFINTGSMSDVEATTISGGEPVINITESAAGTRILGLTVKGGHKGVVTYGYAEVINNRFISNDSDAMSLESTGGVIKNNYFEYPTDDCIDADDPGDSLIEGNYCKNASDDGIEIRNYDYSGPTLTITMQSNTFVDVGEDGIQLIDYPANSDRVYKIYRNLIVGSRDAGLGLMDNGETKEDFRAASMPERVEVINNTFVDNNYGISGGDNMIAINNIIMNSETLGMKGVNGSSIAAYNLFYGNGTNYTTSNIDGDSTTVANPNLDPNHRPQTGSPAIDGGVNSFTHMDQLIFSFPADYYNGQAVDLGCYETN